MARTLTGFFFFFFFLVEIVGSWEVSGELRESTPPSLSPPLLLSRFKVQYRHASSRQSLLATILSRPNYTYVSTTACLR